VPWIDPYQFFRSLQDAFTNSVLREVTLFVSDVMAEMKERCRGACERKLCLADSHLAGPKETSRRIGTDFVFATKTMHVFLFSSYMPRVTCHMPCPSCSPYLVALTSLGKWHKSHSSSSSGYVLCLGSKQLPQHPILEHPPSHKPNKCH
jgi:hypothetical protein